jgi:hypothetical protein
MTTQSISGHNSQAGLLRNTLRADAIFSGVSGLIFVLAATPVAEFIGMAYPVALIIIGVGFFPWSYMVYRTAMAASVNDTAVRSIIILNIVWVIASYLFLWLSWSTLTVAGKWFVALQGEVVFLFGLFQYIGLRRIRRGDQ